MPLQGPEPKPGDMIVFKHFFYQHWAIYVGNGEVVHLTAEGGRSILSFRFGGTAVVRKDRLESVADGCSYMVNNKYDRRRSPYPPIKIVQEALELVGMNLTYEVTSANCEHFVAELRYGERFSDQDPEPKLGDLFEFKRALYQHWAIYVGNGEVVHLTDQDGWSSLSSVFGGTAVVRKDRLESVADGCSYTVNNKYDIRSSPYPPTKIVREALELVGKRLMYDVARANCEHFVTALRYGEMFSDQVDDAKKYAAGGAVLVAGAAATAVISGMRTNRQQH